MKRTSDRTPRVPGRIRLTSTPSTGPASETVGLTPAGGVSRGHNQVFCSCSDHMVPITEDKSSQVKTSRLRQEGLYAEAKKPEERQV